MAEFWEACNPGSRAILGYFYKMKHGHYPDWDERSGKVHEKQPVTMSPEVEAEHLEDTARFMEQSPSRSRGE